MKLTAAHRALIALLAEVAVDQFIEEETRKERRCNGTPNSVIAACPSPTVGENISVPDADGN